MAGKVGAPYGNQNARKRKGHGGMASRGIRAHLSKHVNYSSPIVQAKMKRDAKYKKAFGL